MIQNAEVPPEQEINYLRQYTRGEVQRLVDSYRKQQHREPKNLLDQLWQELEKRFGNTALIAHTLIKKLAKAAKFTEKESKKLQEFADLCVELDSQLEFLPGLACLNYPNTISPILEKIPSSLCSKWEKEVAKYAEQHQNAYPGFHRFTTLTQKQATLQNHPNILAGFTTAPRDFKPRKDGIHKSSLDAEAKVLKVTTQEPEEGEEVLPKEKREVRCLFHDTAGHHLTNCKAFARKTLSERMEWIKQAKLCFRCFSPGHQASNCKMIVKCDKCGSPRHQELLYVEKRKDDSKSDDGEEEDGEKVSSKCTTVCQNENSGGRSCAKIVLVDVFHEEPDHLQRVYAILDDQSNASMISTELADKLSLSGP